MIGRAAIGGVDFSDARAVTITCRKTLLSNVVACTALAFDFHGPLDVPSNRLRIPSVSKSTLELVAIGVQLWPGDLNKNVMQRRLYDFKV